MISFNELKKYLKTDRSGYKKIKIALLSDHSSQLLRQAIVAWGAAKQIDFDVWEAEYDQIELQIMDGRSDLYLFQPSFVYIDRSSEKLLSAFYKCEPDATTRFASDERERIEALYHQLTSRTGATVIMNTYPETDNGIFGHYAASFEGSFIYQLRKLNLMLMSLAQEKSNLFLLDVSLLVSIYGRDFAFDSRLYYRGGMSYSVDFLPVVGKHLSDIVLAHSGVVRKCLVMDLDNTMWGGIIGDDGMEGIQIGELGLGKVYTELQQWVKQLRRRGIIIAVCSKNTESIALEPFISHPDMVLRLEDIAVFVANWENKVDNILHIKTVLNIGLDSMVFVDDNPFERGMVRLALPELTVPELPDDPAGYLQYLISLNLFETASFTEEDEHRTRLYQEEQARVAYLRNFEQEDAFLKELQMVSDVKTFDSFSMPRIAQLTQRSNQFNLRTVRYTEKDIEEMARSHEYASYSFTLEDRFGHHGLIGVVILKKSSETELFIDTWIMSCRVLKRSMEQFMLNMVAAWAKAHNYGNLLGEYIPTKKNGIVKDHYRELGFLEKDGLWLLDLQQYSEKETHITKR